MKSIKLTEEAENNFLASCANAYMENFNPAGYRIPDPKKDGCYLVDENTNKHLQSMLRDFSLCFACLQKVFDSENPKAAFEKFRDEFFALLPPDAAPFPPNRFVTLEDFLEWKSRLDAAHMELGKCHMSNRFKVFNRLHAYLRQADVKLREQLQTAAKKRLERLSSSFAPETLQSFTDFIDNALVEEVVVAKHYDNQII